MRRLLAPAIGWREDPAALSKAVVALGVTIPCAVSAAFTLLLALRLSGHLRSAAVAALMLAFGSLVWPYSKYGFNAGLAGAALTIGAYGLSVGWLDRRLGVRALVSGARPGVPAGAGPLSDRLDASLDSWWLYLYYLGVIPVSVGLLVGTLLLSGGATLLGAVWRRTRAPD